MKQLAMSVSALSLLAAMPTMAADYPDLFRPAYEADFVDTEIADPLDFEIGLRYWYSKGGQDLDVVGDEYSARDTSHIVEAHFRIDDYSTDTYLKGMAGYAASIEGDYFTSAQGEQTMHNGRIAYTGADFGVLPFGNDTVRFGGFVGYQYWHDSPDMGRENYASPDGSFHSELNDFGVHALRLGLTARADINQFFDINAEVAVIPYGWMSGTYGAFNVPTFAAGGDVFQQGSAGDLSGMVYGATGELMLGIHPTENLTMRVGGRAWYLEGKPRMDYTVTEVGNPSNAMDFVSEAVFSQFRYGLLGELTYKF